MADKSGFWRSFFEGIEDPRAATTRSLEARLVELERRVGELEAPTHRNSDELRSAAE